MPRTPRSLMNRHPADRWSLRPAIKIFGRPLPESRRDVSIESLRKIFAIFLLAAFLLPFLTPLLAYAADEDLGLPACCRRSGKHHCSTSMVAMGQADQHKLRFNTVSDKCPGCPGLVQSSATHSKAFTVSTADAIFAAWVSHPCGVAQTESRRRISRDRSRRKRGPPSTTLA